MIQAADTVGVFQIESRAQMQTLPQIKPGEPRRPRRRGGDHPARPDPGQRGPPVPAPPAGQGGGHLPPSEPRSRSLEETLGVILYQEQVMKIAIDVAGFSAAESDGFRRAMGTWRSSREMEKLHAQFVDGCITGNGLTEEQAEELFRQVAAFASFGFNKSHAAAFARTAYESRVPEALLPGPVRGRADQRPADGLLPGRGADQRRQAPRRVRPAGGRQPEPLPDHHRVGGHARRATPRGRRHRRAAGARSRVVSLRRARAAKARDRWAAPTPTATASASACISSRASARRRARRSTPRSARAARITSLADLVARTGLSEEVVERLIRAGALDSLGEPRRELLWQLREVAGAARSGRRRSGRVPEGAGSTARSPPATDAGARPATTVRARAPGRPYAILSLDARRQVTRAVPAGARRGLPSSAG